METGETKSEPEAIGLPVSKKQEQRAALAEFKRLHQSDPEKAREAARLWFEQHGERSETGAVADSSFHRRKLSEADPERAEKAAEALRKCEADAGRAQDSSRETLKEWRKRNPNKVKKLNKLYRERQKTK